MPSHTPGRLLQIIGPALIPLAILLKLFPVVCVVQMPSMAVAGVVVFWSAALLRPRNSGAVVVRLS